MKDEECGTGATGLESGTGRAANTRSTAAGATAAEFSPLSLRERAGVKAVTPGTAAAAARTESLAAGGLGPPPAGVTLELLTSSDAGPVPVCPAAAIAACRGPPGAAWAIIGPSLVPGLPSTILPSALIERLEPLGIAVLFSTTSSPSLTVVPPV